MTSQRDHDRVLGKVREICLSFPEVTERLSHGSPTWFIRDKKTLATFVENHHGDGNLGIWLVKQLDAEERRAASLTFQYFNPRM